MNFSQLVSRIADERGLDLFSEELAPAELSLEIKRLLDLDDEEIDYLFPTRTVVEIEKSLRK